MEFTNNETVSVYGPQFCDPNSLQVFCSTFELPTSFECSATLGSPVMCGDQSTVDGFLLTAGQCLIDGSNRATLEYHSVDYHRWWIEEVSSKLYNESFSPDFIVNVLHYTAPNFDHAIIRCSATIITVRHVLTTASCVDVTNTTKITIQAPLIHGNEVRELEKVFIHPNFDVTHPRTNNVAVLKVKSKIN